MKKDMEIVNVIKNNDQRRINFFLDKLEKDIKKYDFFIERNDLLKIFLEAAYEYTEEDSHTFYYFVFDYIKEKLGIEIKGNDFFSGTEMIIIKRFLEKDNDGYFISSEEIAETLGISIVSVTATIQKFRNIVFTNKLVTEELFPNAVEILDEREVKGVRKASKKGISREEIILLGYYTGQIDDICLDIDVLAEKYDSSVLAIKSKLRDAYNTLKVKSNYNILKEFYPNIDDLLIIRASSLDIKLPDYIRTAKTNKSKKIIKKKTENLASPVVKPHNSKVYRDAEFLKEVFQRDRAISYSKIAKELSFSVNGFLAKKNNILNEFDNNKIYRENLLKLYPTFIEDKKKFEENKSKKNSNIEKTIDDNTTNDTDFDECISKHMDKALKFLEKLFTKKDDDSFYTTKEIINSMNISVNSFNAKRNRLLKRLEFDKELRTLLLKRRPSFFEDMKEWQKNTKERTRFIPEENKIEDEVNLLKELYGNSNNKFGLIKRLAKQKEINYYSLRNRINRLTEKIDKNEEFRNLVINYYPTLLEDKERYENGSTKLSNEEKLAIKEEKYLKESVKLLQLTLQRQENDKYLSNDEIADYFSIKKSSLFVRKRILKEKLQDNAFLEKVIKLYPDYLNDLEIYKNTKNAKTNKSIDKEEKKLNDAVNFLTNLFIKKNGIFLNTTAIANMMGLKYPTFINKRKKYLLEYDTNEELRKIVLSKCPTFDQDRIVFQSQIKVGRKYVYNDEKSEKDALFLIRCVARDECNKFPSFKSIALESNSTVEKVQEKFNKLSKIFNENEDFRNKVLKIMPYFIEEYNHFIEENNNQLEEKNIDDSLIDDDLTYKEQLVINSLYSGESKTLISKSKIAKNLNISPAYFSILENSAIKKITNNPNINKLYPKVLEEAFIRKNHSVRRSIKINAEEINSIKDKARLYDIPKYDFSDTKSKLIEAIKFLDESIYKDYISLCTIEQKAILALRFGFLNNYSYSSKDISELFNITSNEVDILVNECIKFSNLYNDKEKEFKK